MMRKHKSDRVIGALTVILLGLGLIVIYAIGPMRVNVMNAAYGSDLGENYFFFHQIMNVCLAILVIIAAFKLPYAVVRKFGFALIMAGLVLCGLLALLALVNSSLAKCELGACRWYNLGGLSLQPAEILKLGLVL